MTEDEARRIGEAIAEAAELKRVPIEIPMERRAYALKCAIETKSVAMSLREDASVAESAGQVLEAAGMYLTFIETGSVDGD